MNRNIFYYLFIYLMQYFFPVPWRFFDWFSSIFECIASLRAKNSQKPVEKEQFLAGWPPTAPSLLPQIRCCPSIDPLKGGDLWVGGPKVWRVAAIFMWGGGGDILRRALRAAQWQRRRSAGIGNEGRRLGACCGFALVPVNMDVDLHGKKGVQVGKSMS